MISQKTNLSVSIGVLSHNEELRIENCLLSILSDKVDAEIHVIVNGSTDKTAERARAIPADNIVVHEFAEGGKSRSWNRFVFDTLDAYSDIHIFVDGDAEVAPGSLAALIAALAQDDRANLASALPMNGRNAQFYRNQMRAQHGVFGDLYAVKGPFLARMKERSIRLPDDLIGDDGLIGALAKTDLEKESNWDDRRVVVCEGGGFLCQPVHMAHWRTVRMQYRRMINYSIRHFQNAIISQIMRDTGPAGLPQSLSSVYPEHQSRLIPRRSPVLRYFDRKALARMR